jgi:hypothetical protein
LRVSGVFSTDNLDNILGAIALTLPVKVERIGQHEVLLTPAGAGGGQASPGGEAGGASPR